MKFGKLGFKGTGVEPYWESIKRIITESDLVLEILDARLVELSRNEEVERLVKEVGRPMVYVVNKSDLVPREDLKKQVQALQESGAYVVFVSAKKKKTIRLLMYMIKKVFNKYGKHVTIKRKKGEPKVVHRVAKADIVVGVLGYPNVGKSSLINALCHKKKVKVSKKAGTTHGIHWIRLNDEIKLIDSPGVIPLKADDDIRYGLIGARDNEKLRNPDMVAYAIIKYFVKDNKKALERLYDVEIPEDELDDTYAIIERIAKRKAFLLKGGVIDENRVIELIVRNWQEGKLRM